MVTCRIAACVVGILSPAVAAMGAPPRVIKATPDHGDVDVDPALSEIRIEFDQDMNTTGGYSICGGGPQFPSLQGKPRWADQRTLVLRVKLEPNHDYALSINCPAARNCRSAAGAPAEPYPISFRTAGGSGGGAVELSPDDNKRALAELRQAINSRYAYRDLRGVNWNALFARKSAGLVKKKTPAAFARAVASMLAAAEDVHMWVTVGNATFGTHQRSIEPNYNHAVLSKRVPQWREPNPCVRTGRFADGVGYIMITSWSNDCRDDLEAVFEALDQFSTAPGLIVDVRPNSGGDELLARTVAGCFIERPAVYSRNRNVAPGTPGGFTEVYDRVVEPKKGRPRYRGAVAVLIGPAVMSSCESFVLMMQQAPKCQLIGAPTYGSSGNPKPVELSNGVTVFMPSWQDLFPDGSILEGVGIKPDIPVNTTTHQLRTEDPVLEAARQALRKP